MYRILCFGDSNTYGYDPRSFSGSRYPPDARWTDLLGEEYEILNAGENGRAIPRRPFEIQTVISLVQRSLPLDAVLVMLGGNDLLCFAAAEEAADRMRRFLEAVLPAVKDSPLVLVAPLCLRLGAWVETPELVEQSRRLGALYRDLAQRLGVRFIDAGTWDIALTYDGVHFSEAGHRAFADRMKRALSEALAKSDSNETYRDR